MTRTRLELTDSLSSSYELLPIRFHTLNETQVVVTNMVGEPLILDRSELEAAVAGQPSEATLNRMKARHMARAPGEVLPVELLAVKLRTQKRRLSESTSLHMFVVTLRCEHTCRYCQVSRQSTSHGEFDMAEETASAALDLVFRSPARELKIEFQGGEPLLNFTLVKWIVEQAEQRAISDPRKLALVITTNLALVTDDILDFCAEHGIGISTSLDGPRELHNHNRRRPGQNSWDRAVEGICRVHERLGPQYISALMTTTEASLDQPEAIIDTYADLGLTSIFLRPISPYGFATRLRGGGQYDAQRWLDFYRRGLSHIINLNRNGTPMKEAYTSIIAKKIFTNDDPGYVDLTSPSGIGIGGIVYNYDGGVYASDEGRMLAEMHDQTFRLGNVHDSYRDLLTSPRLLNPLWESFTLSCPKCDLCAFESYCGSDPVFHHTTQADFAGHKTFSAFCQRNTGVFVHLFQLMVDDPFSRELLWSWAHT